MDIQMFQKLKEDNKKLFIVFFVLINLFLFSLFIFFLVSTMNKLREGDYIGQEITSKPNISVSGTGEVYSKPDLALISFSVVTEAKTAQEAMNQNSEKMNKVIDFIKSQGVKSKDLKTTIFNISPRYEYQKEGEMGAEISIYPPLPSKRVLVGYEVTQQLETKIRDLDKVGQIIEGAANAGANQIGDLQLMIDEIDKLRKEAREQAVKEAKNKAKELASQLGVRLVRITNFFEGGYVPRVYEYESVKELGIGGGAPVIETGENKITITVTITYEIN